MHLGDYPASASVYFKWNTYAVAGEGITRATNGTVRIYKNGSTTERSSSAGITDTEDFDSTTGLHHCTIDLSDNTDSGFYAAGNEYQVVVNGMTVDGKAVNPVIAHFSIERSGGNLALLKDGTVGLAALETLVDDIESRLTATRAGYLDNLSAGAVATQASVNAVDDFIDTEVAAILAAVDTEVAAILADTNELQTDWVNGGRLDLLIDGIKAKTDNLPSDPADASVIAGLIAALPTDCANELLDNTDAIATGVTPREALARMASILCGLTSGAGTTSEVFYIIGQAATGGNECATFTLDSNNNRTAVTWH